MFLTRKETAQRLKVSVDTVTKLVTAGQLTAVKVGSQLRIDDGKLNEFIATNTTTATATN